MMEDRMESELVGTMRAGSTMGAKRVAPTAPAVMMNETFHGFHKRLLEIEASQRDALAKAISGKQDEGTACDQQVTAAPDFGFSGAPSTFFGSMEQLARDIDATITRIHRNAAAMERLF